MKRTPDQRIPSRLPKGTCRDDYEPEVLAAFDRKRWRRGKAQQRQRQRHAGGGDVLITLDKEARAILDHLCRTHGWTQSQAINHLLETQDVQLPSQP